ncbi:MAG TPA: protein kinase [Thermoanaerobaculia bacterium]|nr:protein kinase [Thermoanaerobaculia bacterium]
MHLAAGHRLGPYVIEEMAGSGGMGEVYRARDTRVGRVVAIKVLPAGTMEAAEARFEREGRAISQLSHPHICSLFDLGRHDGTAFLVMEYLEGQTLASRLGRGPLPLRDVIRYGSEIAAALEHAHRRGIIHRDLKPGNIMLTATGAKLLDFGLARPRSPEPGPLSPQGETEKKPITEQGTIVGTSHYMSPEQIEGKPLDHRTDIFSLGIVLYEMVSGRRPFEGASAAAVSASILTSDPRALPAGLPPALQHLIDTALEKDPERRWQTAHDIALQLGWIGGTLSGERAEPARTRRRLRWSWLLVPLALAGGAVAGWLAAERGGPAAERREPVRLRLVVPPPLQLRDHVEVLPFALSPDGRSIVFTAHPQGGAQGLYLRRFDSEEVARIDGTEGADSPFWSPDGKWIGFAARGKLWKTRADRPDAPIALCDVSVFGTNATWGNGVILFAERPFGRPEIQRVSDAGGTPAPVTRLAPHEWRHTLPQFIPGTNRFLYLAMTRDSLDRTLLVGSLDGAEAQPLLGDTALARAAGEHIFYVREGKLFQQRADLRAGRLLSEPHLLADHIRHFYPTGTAQFDVAGDGTVVYRTRTSRGRLFLTDRAGREIRVFDETPLFFGASFSPDGRRIAAGVLLPRAATPGIWLYDAERGGRDRLTAERATEVFPVWTPDGRSLIYGEGKGSPPLLVRRPLDGGAKVALTRSGLFELAGNFSPDGKALYLTQIVAGRPAHILRVMLDDPSRVEPVVSSAFENVQGYVSPSGQWLAFSSNSTGAHEVYVVPLAGGERIRISNGGGNLPRWNRRGDEIFYWSGKTLMSARPGRSGRWNDAALTELFRIGGTLDAFDVSPSGESFVVGESHPGEGDGDLHVILNAR